MKPITILVGIVVIAAIAIFFTGNRAEAPVVADDVESANSMIEEETFTEEDSHDDHEDGEMHHDDDFGTDQGMEFPEPDIDFIEPPAAVDPEPESTPVEVSTPEPVPEPESFSRVFTLDSFSFGYSETELRVKEGDTVTINLTNSGGFHDWVLDEFGAATEQIRAGETTSVTFVADRKGSFEYYCSVGSHRAQGMVGTLIVE